MIRRKTILSSALALILTPLTMQISSAADNSWYVGASIDSVDVSDVDTLSAPVADVARRINLDTDSDTSFSLFVGKTLLTTDSGNQLSLDLAYSESEHEIDRLNFMNREFVASEGGAEGSIEMDTLMLRAAYKFEMGAFKPYVGLGLGSVDIDVEARYSASVGTPAASMPPFATDGSSATALQFRLGAEYQLSDRMGLFIEYAKTDVDDIEFIRRGGGPGGLNSTTQSGDFDFDKISLGANFTF